MREPWLVLGPLVVAQWLAVLAFTLTVRHNGWLFYQGGDETFYYTSAWVLGDGHLPQTTIGYGWSLLLAPIALFAGPNFLSALPAVVLVQTLIFLPLALLAVYGIAARLAGRLVGYGTAVLWVVAPLAVIPLFDQRYHDRYVEQFLPQAFGLTGLADFPSMVFLLVAAYFAVRTLDTGELSDGLLSGLAAGFAVGVKPANLLFLPPALLALALARRWRGLLLFGVALLPALLTLTLWKERGLGHLPGLSAPAYHLAAPPLRASVATPPVASLFRHAHVDWSHLQRNFTSLREFFWSVRVLQWLLVAGVIAVGRRSLSKTVLLGGWFVMFLLFKGSASGSTVDSGSFFRFLMPGFPAFLLLVGATPVLAPTLGPRLAERFPAARTTLSWRSRRVLAATAVLAAVPLIVVAAASPAQRPAVVRYLDEGVVVPLTRDIPLAASPTPAGVALAWRRPPGTTTSRVFYRVFRTRGSGGVTCQQTGGATDCVLGMRQIGTTRGTGWSDRPGHGRWTYRVGLSANWRNDLGLGDVLALSRPVSVSVP